MKNVNLFHTDCLSDSFHHLEGVEFAFRNTVSAGGTLVGFFHHDAFSVFISDYLQYATGASLGAKPAARTIFIDHVDNFLFCTLASVQSAQNIEQDCRNYIQCIHFFRFYGCKITAMRHVGQ